MEAPSPSSELQSEFVLQNKSRACKRWFKECLDIPEIDYDDWMEQKWAHFNWWTAGLDADKSGPGSLDARLRLRPDVRDVVVDVLDGLEAALCKYHEIVTSDSSLSERETLNVVWTDGQTSTVHETGRASSPWSDMTDGSDNGSSSAAYNETDEDAQGDCKRSSPLSSKSTEDTCDHHSKNQQAVSGDQNTANSTSPSSDVLHEQRVYIQTNLEILIRIHTTIKHSGLKFWYQHADDALKQVDEKFQQRKAVAGESQALREQVGEHERFRRYLTRLVLRNGYTENFMHIISCTIDECCENMLQNMKGGIDKFAEGRMKKWDRKIDKLSEIVKPVNKNGYSDILLQNKLLIVFRAYFNDPARLTTVQCRLVNANVVRRNRLLYAGYDAKASSQAAGEQAAGEHFQRLQAQHTNRRSAEADQLYLTPASPFPPQSPSIPPANLKQGESKTGKDHMKQPATTLESIFRITGALSPDRATKSAAAKMSASLEDLEYPKCPNEHGGFLCPYCSTTLTEEFTEKSKWRGHVAQDLCAYVCVFEDCKSPDDMFASTYAWMSHMASFHSDMEWVCPKCAKDSNPGAGNASTFAFEKPKELENHIIVSHPTMDLSELDLLVEASRRVIGIKKVRCPLCRPGLVTSDTDDGEMATYGLSPLVSTDQAAGLVQLEKDEHIATHMHVFALYSLSWPDEMALEDSAALSSDS